MSTLNLRPASDLFVYLASRRYPFESFPQSRMWCDAWTGSCPPDEKPRYPGESLTFLSLCRCAITTPA